VRIEHLPDRLLRYGQEAIRDLGCRQHSIGVLARRSLKRFALRANGGLFGSVGKRLKSTSNFPHIRKWDTKNESGLLEHLSSTWINVNRKKVQFYDARSNDGAPVPLYEK
jgi:hypothetical protein